MSSPKKYADVGMFLCSIVLLAMTLNLSYRVQANAFESPRTVPMFVVGIMIALSLLNLIAGMIFPCLKVIDREANGREQTQFTHLTIMVVSLVMYALFLETVGFIFCTFILLNIMFLIYGGRLTLVNILLCAFVSSGCWYIFCDLFKAYLPVCKLI